MSLLRSRRQPVVSRLGIKLFVIILAVNVVIAALVFIAVSRSLDRGFIDYLQTTQASRAETLAEGLAGEWQRRGDWQWLRDDMAAWQRLVRQQLWPGDSPPPQGIDRRLGDPGDFVFHDADGLPVIGLRPSREERNGDELHWLPIISTGEQVGALGYRPPQQLMARMDRIFLSRQQRNLSIIVASLALTSLLLAGGLSWWLGRRTGHMALATRRLTEGDYTMRLPVNGGDELARLSQDFNTLAATLAANREARQRWVSDIAHELRTPLAVLRGEIEAMQDGIRSMNELSLASLSQEVGQLERLVADLRLLAQSDAGVLAVSLAPLDLAETLSLQLEERRDWLADQGLSLEVEIQGSAPIRGDVQRLRQLWHNLLANTCGYTQAPGLLRVRLERLEQHVRISWEDTSPGVPEDELVRLTERLYRVDGSRNRASGGSGLGLSIATALVIAHGGSMQASASTLGGLCWSIEFPLYRGEEADEHHA